MQTVRITGVGDRDREGVRAPPPKNGEIFLGNYHVKIGHFVNFSYIYFSAKMSSPKVDYAYGSN